MIRHGIVAAVLALVACGGSSTPSSTNFSSLSMTAGNEIQNPAVVSNATGTATYVVNGATVNYTISYTNLSGSPTMGHIHVGTPAVSGGVVVPFTGLPSGVTNSFTGSFTAADVKAGTAGGVTVTAGSLDSLLAAFKAGNAYTNIHTTKYGSGEIRGQILPNAQ